MCWRSVNNQARVYVCNGVERKRCPTGVVGCHANSYPTKGYLLKCDNWVGIALLDVVGKV